MLCCFSAQFMAICDFASYVDGSRLQYLAIIIQWWLLYWWGMTQGDHLCNVICPIWDSNLGLGGPVISEHVLKTTGGLSSVSMFWTCILSSTYLLFLFGTSFSLSHICFWCLKFSPGYIWFLCWEVQSITHLVLVLEIQSTTHLVLAL